MVIASVTLVLFDYFSGTLSASVSSPKHRTLSICGSDLYLAVKLSERASTKEALISDGNGKSSATQSTTFLDLWSRRGDFGRGTTWPLVVGSIGDTFGDTLLIGGIVMSTSLLGVLVEIHWFSDLCWLRM